MINKIKKCFFGSEDKSCEKDELTGFVEGVLRSTECLIGNCAKQDYSHNNETYKIDYNTIKRIKKILSEKDICLSRTSFTGNEHIIKKKIENKDHIELKTINIVEI